MSNFLKPRNLFIAILLILLVTNIVILAGVAVNRSGKPQALLSLTERELNLPYRNHAENSSLSLRLVWRTLGEDENSLASAWRPPTWFTAAKLKELGYSDAEAGPATARRSDRPTKEVFIVLEFDGPAYQQALQRAEAALAQVKLDPDHTKGQAAEKIKQAEARLADERNSASRLFAIDAGLNPSDLRQKYGAPSRYTIVRGLVRPFFPGADGEESRGTIVAITTDRIAVPLEIRRELAKLVNLDQPTSDRAPAPRYTVELSYGSRHEPWITAVGKAEVIE